MPPRRKPPASSLMMHTAAWAASDAASACAAVVVDDGDASRRSHPLDDRSSVASASTTTTASKAAVADEPIQLVERFNPGALAYVIEHFHEFTHRSDTSVASNLDMLKKYRALAGPSGVLTATYKRPEGYGRLFAVAQMSMQSMLREARNAIAHQLYDDVDIANCQPSLLMQFCERRNIECPLLKGYCADRDAVLSSLSADRAAAKQAVIKVINGGAAVGVRPTAWLDAFEAEMARVREAVANTPEGAGYLETVVRKMKKKTSKKQDKPNVLGSVMSYVCCELENAALMAMRERLESPEVGLKVGVLVFDGCMVEKSDRPLTAEVLAAVEAHVLARTGYRVTLAVKDMAQDMFPVPASVLALSRAPRFANTDDAASDHFIDDVRDVVRCYNGVYYVKVGNTWTSDSSLLDRELLASCLSANICSVTATGATRPMSANVVSARHIIAATLAKLPNDPLFYDKLWGSSLGTLCYANGVYDMRVGRFFAYDERPDVISPRCIPFDFPPRPSDVVMRDVYKRVMLSTLGNDDLAKTVLQLLARGIAGEYEDKQWVVMMGDRNCGKGVLQRANEIAFAGYVNTINANAFMLSGFASGDAAKSKSWALDCEFARLTYTNEVTCDATNKRIKLDGNMIKGFQSGGDSMSARKNHKDERTFRVASKLIMNLNDIPEVTPRDAMRNMLLIKFPHRFVPAETLTGEGVPIYFLEADDTLKSKFLPSPDVVAAWTWLVLEAYTPGPVVPCAAVRAATASYLEDVGDEDTTMVSSFEFTRDRKDFVLVRQLRDFVVGRNISLTKVRDMIERMGYKVDKNCCVNGKCHGTGYLGVRFKDLLEETVER